MTKSNTKK